MSTIAIYSSAISEFCYGILLFDTFLHLLCAIRSEYLSDYSSEKMIMNKDLRDLNTEND